MMIKSCNGTIDTETDVVAFVFTSDDELNSFLSKLASTKVRTSGVRIFSSVPENKKLTPLQEALLNIIDGFDGVGCKNESEHQEIIDDSVDGLKNIIQKFS